MIAGYRIRELRIKKGYSQEELGDLLGVTKVTICGYEKGTRIPNLAKFLELVNYLNTDPDYLLGRDAIGIAEDSDKYRVNIAKEDIEVLNELKRRPELYNKIVADPRRSFELIERKLL